MTKQILKSFLVVAFGLWVAGCSDNENEAENPDNYIPGYNVSMKIDKPEVSVSREGTEFTIAVSNYEQWHFSSVKEQIGEADATAVYEQKWPNDPLTVSGDWFTLEIPDENKAQLHCKISPNKGETGRTLKIIMWEENAYGHITITQE